MILTWVHSSLGNDDDEGSHIKRVKEHKVNRKPGFSDFGGNNNDYKEDTKLEDRLAMEAEEEKKYETGEGYGPGGGGGGGAGWDDGAKGVNWATNIQRQDAAEVTDVFKIHITIYWSCLKTLKHFGIKEKLLETFCSKLLLISTIEWNPGFPSHLDLWVSKNDQNRYIFAFHLRAC